MPTFKPCANPDCGKPIDVNELRRYCSAKCRNHANYLKRSKPANVGPFREERTCVYCGKKFTAKHPSARCCSQNHRQALYRQLKKLPALVEYDAVLAAA